MTDPISSTTLLIRLFTESSTTLLASLLTLKQWCLTAIGPFLLSLVLAGFFALFFLRTQYDLDEKRKESNFRREERGKNNDLKRRVLEKELERRLNAAPTGHGGRQGGHGMLGGPAMASILIKDEETEVDDSDGTVLPLIRPWQTQNNRNQREDLSREERRDDVRQFLEDLEKSCT